MKADSDDLPLHVLLRIAERGKAAEMTRLAAAVSDATTNESGLEAARRETAACVEELSRLASIVSLGPASAIVRNAALESISMKLLSACAAEAEAESAHLRAIGELDAARARLVEADRDVEAQATLDGLARSRMRRRQKRRTERSRDEDATTMWLATGRLLDD